MSTEELTRREFLTFAGVAGCASVGTLCGSFSPRIAEQTKRAKKSKLKAWLGEAIKYPNSVGDLWAAAWADDDNVYLAADDATGFNNACNSNICMNRISGGPPPNFEAVTINPMSEFGKHGESRKEDGAAWKATGLTSIDSVLYMFVSRQATDAPRYSVYEQWDSSIIKSHDHGKTWSAVPKLDQAMFPGHTFSTAFFVQYGKDGQGTKDGADQYVYASSNDGCWNNGNWMILGRVRRHHIGRLNPNDWEFVHGFDEKGHPIWRARHDNARYIFCNPGKTSEAAIHYIAGLGLYIMPQWYHVNLDEPDEKLRWQMTRFEFYSAPTPWGPWTLFHTQENPKPQGWYNPYIPNKFISSDGRKFWIFTAGTGMDGNGGYESEFYALYMIPVTVEVES